MKEDTWWAFIVNIDRKTLLLELPGSVPDRRMREQHAERVRDFYAPGNGSIRALGKEANENHSAAVVKPRPTATPLEKEIAAYAANKRKKVA
jgi:hypothetical protein